MLITVEEFTQLRNVGKKVDSAKIEEAIKLAEKSDLTKVLGNFYFDVLINIADPDYIALLDGGVFEYCNESFQHDGLKALLADFAYSRYTYIVNANFDPFGMTRKASNLSEPVDSKLIKDISKQASIDADTKFTFIEKFILSKPEKFKRYGKNQSQTNSFQSFRYTRLNK